MKIQIANASKTMADGLMPVQTGESWNTAVMPKVAGAWNLHKAAAQLPQLMHFVCFSSIVSIFGNPGACDRQAECSSYSQSE